MKKISLFVVSVSILVGSIFSSCSSEEVEGATSTALADGAAAWGMYTELAAAGACAGPAGGAGIGAVSVAWGIAASAWGFRTVNPNGTFVSQGVNLPAQYYNNDSKFECLGKLHNQFLDGLTKMSKTDADEVLNKIANWDSLELKKYYDAYVSCANIIEPSAFTRPAPACRTALTAQGNYYRTATPTQLLNDMNQRTDPKSNYVKGILNNVQTSVKGKVAVENIVTTLKNEITQVTNSNAPDKNEKLTFLYVLKHSVYFWHK
jgi:hypothetical protein